MSTDTSTESTRQLEDLLAQARPNWWPLPLNKDLFAPDEEEFAFLKQTTGIQDEQELREHVIRVQEEAYNVFPYPCIRNFNFTKLKISRMPAYPRMLELAKTRPGAIYLDIGCCFGNDARKAVVDGYPMENIICSDLRPQYWDLGYELFRDKETFHVPFIAGDVFDPNFLWPTPSENGSPAPLLKEVKTLTELHEQVSVIHASAFFHLFDQVHQEKLAYLLASLLVKESGSLIFGSHIGASTAGPIREGRGYAHDPQTWTDLWEAVFGKGKCEVKALVRPWKAHYGDLRGDRELLVWSVVLV